MSIEFAYICNRDPEKQKICSGLSGRFCGECNHTTVPKYAKNPETVKLSEEIKKKFESIEENSVRLIEKEE